MTYHFVTLRKVDEEPVWGKGRFLDPREISHRAEPHAGGMGDWTLQVESLYSYRRSARSYGVTCCH
jgi:hypothetical protein